MWLLLAQLAIWQPVSPPTLHAGWWQSCQGAERVLEHRVNGKLVWELHLQAEDFGLYTAHLDGPDHLHAGPPNLLTAPRFDDLQTRLGSRQWTIPSLHLWVSIVRAGEPDEGCEAFYVKVVRQ